MIVKIKAFEDIPEKYKCCPARIVEIKQSAGNINEINNVLEIAHYHCYSCGHNVNGKGYKHIDGSLFYMVDIIDIAEGEF